MIRKGIKKWLSYITADKENFSLEHRLFLSSIIVGILISVFGSFLNLVLTTSPIAVIIPLVLSFLLIILYYLVRFKKITNHFLTPFIVIGILCISIVWIFNGGINGSNILDAIVVLILGLVVVPDKIKKNIFILFIVVNIFILLIQLYRPDLIVSFPSQTDRFIDYLITLIYTSFIIFLIIRFVHKNYTKERLKAVKSEQSLKERLRELNGTYSLGQLAEKSDQLDDIFNEFVNTIVPQSLEYPEKVFVSLEIEDKKYCNIENFRLSKTQKYLFEPINVHGVKIGELIVAYTEELYLNDFFEQQLISNYASRISKITERIKARQAIEESEKKLRLLNTDKDRFITILGHDLKNPLNNIMGLSFLLMEEIENLKAEEIPVMAKLINQAAKVTNNLLDDVLMWARAQQGTLPFKPQMVDFSGICKNTIDILSPTGVAKNVSMLCPDVSKGMVYADINMLKTIMLNLVSNAIKFSFSGGVVHIKADETPEGVTISVADHGIGISPENVKKLFDISQVVTTKGTAEESGTGLGLLLCKDFVEKHGGSILVESEVGKGSEFKFTLMKYGKE